jgi:hypothetical protein
MASSVVILQLEPAPEIYLPESVELRMLETLPERLGREHLGARQAAAMQDVPHLAGTRAHGNALGHTGAGWSRA